MEKINGSNLEAFKKSASVGMSWELADFPKQQVQFEIMNGKKDPDCQFIRFTAKINGVDRKFALKYDENLFISNILTKDKSGYAYTGKELAVIGGKLIS